MKDWKSAKNFSIISIWFLTLGLVDLVFLSSTINNYNWLLRPPAMSLYFLSSIPISALTATPRVYFYAISWTYFSTYTIWGITTIF